MSDNQPEPPVDLGIYSRVNATEGLDPADKVAAFVSLIWIVLCTLFVSVVGLGDSTVLGPLRFLIFFLAVAVPVALIWIAAIALKSSAVIRDESNRLQASMDAMRQIYVSQAQMAATTMGPNVERKIDEIVQAQKRAETSLANMSTPPQQSAARVQAHGQSAVAVAQPEHQRTLALATPDGQASQTVSIPDFVSAMNFPETAEDRAGFAALRRALADHRVSGLIRASQDILTLLSQDGIYMDDLTPDRSRTEVWRKFAAGERGYVIAGLGGIRDRSSLALSSTRMRQDSIFRDASHHFLRAFDKTFSTMAENLTDQEIAAMAETRTARAFMLLGRVAGMFD
ncbi:hypothetical protein N9L47_03355 [Rhodobacteraceae bacterium]|nr:hypothetical protein [Paracoccaceae bacterium]